MWSKMVDVTISVSSELAALFPKAVNYYNLKNGTDYTNIEMVKKLAIDFIRDRLHELEHVDADVRFKSELEGVPEFEDL